MPSNPASILAAHVSTFAVNNAGNIAASKRNVSLQ